MAHPEGMDVVKKQVRSWDYFVECEVDQNGALFVTKPDPALAERLGYPVEELVGSGAWQQAVPTEDLDRSFEAVRSVGNGMVWEGRVRAEASDGEIVILQLRSAPTLRDDGRVSVLVEARDVTEVAGLEVALAERESRLRLLSEEFGVAMWNTDDALRFTWSSGPALERLGFEENALVGTSFYELFDTEDPTFPAIAAHQRALKGESAYYEVQWHDRTWRALVEPLRDPLDRLVGVLGVAVDLTTMMDVARKSAPPAALNLENPISPDDLGVEQMTLADLTIDPEGFQVRKSGREVSLTVTEFKLLLEFARRPGRVMSREVLAERVWGHRFYGNGASVTMAISRLRDKIEDDPGKPAIIETVRGVGYRATG